MCGQIHQNGDPSIEHRDVDSDRPNPEPQSLIALREESRGNQFRGIRPVSPRDRKTAPESCYDDRRRQPGADA